MGRTHKHPLETEECDMLLSLILIGTAAIGAITWSLCRAAALADQQMEALCSRRSSHN